MNCRYFERLLFENSSESGHELTSYQTRALQEHLLECPDCRALQTDWDRVHEIFVLERERECPAPRAGFTHRWQHRRIEERKAEERQQVWSVLSFFLGAAGMCFSMLVVWGFLSFGTPDDWFINGVQQLAEWLVVWSTVQRLFGSMQEFVMADGGAAALALIILITGGVAAVWGISLQRIIKFRRINS